MKPLSIEGVSEVLRRVVRAMEIEAKLTSHSAEPAWPRAAGPRLAPHSRAIGLRGGVLTVEARSASWINEMSLQREGLRDRMNTEMGHRGSRPGPVQELRLRLGGGFAPVSTHSPTGGVTPAEIESAQAALQEAGPTGAALAARAYALVRKAKARL